jgi:hypothetical protein
MLCGRMSNAMLVRESLGRTGVLANSVRIHDNNHRLLVVVTRAQMKLRF